ncbi:glycosyltransferase family 4 protein [Herbaspirillum sp. NPDC087042]|uniref:glycosyltransferase family 4 protein n=1 Tax=Herbaspirillum sp. NPDC087042 TaxID=3364004 RepID=UPI003802BE3D
MKQDLFARLNFPYYIHGPAYAANTDEAHALHHLCHALNLAGEEAYVTEEGNGALFTPRLTQDRIEAHLRAGRPPIVVYPGSITDNPLGANHIVRYLLAPTSVQTSAEMQVAWRTGLAGASIPLLATPLANDAYAQGKAAFVDQLQTFINASQRRFNPAAEGGTLPPPAPPLMPGLKTTPVAQPMSSTAAAAPVKRRKRIVVYSVESTWSPCPQIRLIRPFTHLQDDWELVWGINNGKLQTDALDHADLIVLHRFTPGLMSLQTLQAIFTLNVPVVYESDDLLNDIPYDHPEAQQGASWKEGIEYAVKHAKAVVVSTEFLAGKYRGLNPAVHVLPNYIDFDMFYRPVPQESGHGKINIGLLGSSIQPSNFALVDEALRALVGRYGERLHIDFVGWECPKGWIDHPLATFRPFVHQYVDYAAQLRQWNWDIALIPLAADEYNQCKSYIKWLDYSAAGIASVFSDVSVYNEVVKHRHTGLLLGNSGVEWLDAITALIEQPEQRRALAEAAQKEVQESFDLHSKAFLYDQTYGRLASAAQSGAAHP